MSRLNLSENDAAEITYEAFGNLDELIPNYAENKRELDSYKKICDAANTQIKNLMLEAGEDTHEAGGYVAKRTVIEKETIDETILLSVLKKHGITHVIKTKEYVDMDELEAYLYNNMPSTDLATDLSKCKSTKEEVRLTIRKAKNKEE